MHISGEGFQSALTVPISTARLRAYGFTPARSLFLTDGTSWVRHILFANRSQYRRSSQTALLWPITEYLEVTVC